MGFQNKHNVITYYKHIAQDSLYLQDFGIDPIHGIGNNATKPKKTNNKKPLPLWHDDVWYYDIEYGIGTTVGKIKYALIIAGRANRYTFVHPLKDLKDSSLLLSMKLFVSQIGRKQKNMYTDRNFKLTGVVVVEFLKTNYDPVSTELIWQVTGVPTNRQN